MAYQPNGDLLWAKRAGGTGEEALNGITTDIAGMCYLTGSYNGSTGFDAHRLSSIGGSDVFVAKYDLNGNALFARKAGGISADAGNAIAVDAQGNSYITGYFSGRAYFGTQELNSLGQQDMFVARLNHINAVSAPESVSAQTGLRAYPNPFSESFTVELSEAQTGTAELVLLDVLGRQIYSQLITLPEGGTNFLVEPKQVLPQGVYVLQVRKGNTLHVTRLVKQ